MIAPTLETPRLRLRAMTPADWPAYAALIASPRALFMGGPFDTRAAWGMFCHDAAGWALFGAGALMAARRDDGVTVGQVGINHGPLYPGPELGWFLYDGHDGQGFATEAARALRDWAFDVGGLTTLVSYTDRDNHASAGVSRRLGATPVPDAPRQPGPENADDLVFRHHPVSRA
jgi:RimJ/RimL family protein N-acetyltransferase